MSKSKLQERASRLDADPAESLGPKTPCRMACGAEQEPYEVYAVRVGERPWSMRLCYPIARTYSGGVRRSAHWPEDQLREAAQSTFRRVRAAYGGTWELHIRLPLEQPSTPMDRDPDARADAERAILAGPDTPGRRFLERAGRTAPTRPETMPLPAWAMPIAGAGPEDAF
jgi:hypothetical protein